MNRFLRNIAVFLVILILIFTPQTYLYVKRDVFLDFKKYDNYSWKYLFQRLGDVSTKKLLLNSGIQYNSFIFGSSRATGVYACYLNQKIDGSNFFQYSNWNETAGGIYAKLKLLDSLGYNIDHVIMYFDTDDTFLGLGEVDPNDHYLLNNQNKYGYFFKHYMSFFSNFNLDKLKILLGLKVEESVFPNWESDPITNDAKHKCTDSILAEYGNSDLSEAEQFTIDSLVKDGFLYERPEKQEFCPSQISQTEKEILFRMNALLRKHHTDFYVVLTPIYDQRKFSVMDMQILRQIFGNRLFDFSGINALTENVYNYNPDRDHFQPFVSKYILDSIISTGNLSLNAHGEEVRN